MAIHKLSITDFLKEAASNPVFDVRSPGEFLQAHIPGACNLPLFSDEERKIVGTLYKQQGKQQAIKAGLGFFAPKLNAMVDEVESLVNKKTVPKKNKILLHCWRGGMRSAAVAWLLDLYGFEVCTLIGGYKSFRRWALNQFEHPWPMKIVGGYTGSGKTAILRQLENQSQKIVDLEACANHKGSAFGGIGQPKQPKQEMFENRLAIQLHNTNNQTFWIEDESQRIGDNVVPQKFWNQMRSNPVYFLDIPFHERLKYITTEYGTLPTEKLVNAIIRIQKRLGPLETKTSIGLLLENKLDAAFDILLTYYDKHYIKSLNNRQNAPLLINKIPALFVDSMANAEKLIQCASSTFSLSS